MPHINGECCCCYCTLYNSTCCNSTGIHPKEQTSAEVSHQINKAHTCVVLTLDCVQESAFAGLITSSTFHLKHSEAMDQQFSEMYPDVTPFKVKENKALTHVSYFCLSLCWSGFDVIGNSRALAPAFWCRFSFSEFGDAALQCFSLKSEVLFNCIFHFHINPLCVRLLTFLLQWVLVVVSKRHSCKVQGEFQYMFINHIIPVLAMQF